MKFLVGQFCGVDIEKVGLYPKRFEEIFEITFTKGSDHQSKQSRAVNASKGFHTRLESGLTKSFSLAILDESTSEANYAYNWNFYFEVSEDQKTVLFGMPFDTPDAQKKIRKFIALIHCEYGYIACLNKEIRTPLFYLVGVNGGPGGTKLITNGPALELMQTIDKWRNHEDSYKTGKIRNIYRYNYLGKSLIEDGIIEEIEALGAGQLTELENGCFEWILTDADEMCLVIEAFKNRIVAA